MNKCIGVDKEGNLYLPNIQIQEIVKEKKQEIERLNNIIDKAIEFIDQVLQYHLQPFDYKQVDEDINTLIGILRGDKE